MNISKRTSIKQIFTKLWTIYREHVKNSQKLMKFPKTVQRLTVNWNTVDTMNCQTQQKRRNFIAECQMVHIDCERHLSTFPYDSWYLVKYVHCARHCAIHVNKIHKTIHNNRKKGNKISFYSQFIVNTMNRYWNNYRNKASQIEKKLYAILQMPVGSYRYAYRLIAE